MNELREGVELRRIVFPSNITITAWEDTVDSLIIRMQPGQGGMVPWVEITFANKKNNSLVNCAFLEGLDFV